MHTIKTLLSGIAISSLLLINSCGDSKEKSQTANSPEFNILASIKHPAAFTSVNVMELLKKSNLKKSKDLPAQIKMMVNSQINQHLNSEAQGLKLEGNIPFAVTAKEDGSFKSVISIFEVLDAKKVGSSLCLYFGGKVQTEGSVSILKGMIPGTGEELFFAWDEKQLVSVFAEEGAKEEALALLKNKNVDSPSNEKVQSFLDNHSDFSSLVFMDTYTDMSNQLSKTTMKKELMEAYKGVTVVASANFNNGDFTFTSDLDGESFISSKFNSVNENTVDKSFLNYLTIDHKAILFGTASLNLDAFINIAEQTGSEHGDYENELDKIGLKKEDITKLLTGEFAFSLLDVENVKVMNGENFSYEDQPKYVLTCGIKDAELLKTTLTNNENVKAIANYYSVDKTFIGVYENKLFASLNEALIQKLANGEQLATTSLSENTPIYGNIVSDMNQLPESFKKLLLTEGGEEVLKIYNEIESIHFSGDIHHTEFKLKLSDDSKNAFEVFSNTLIKNLLPLLLGGMI